jgi:uncharacterized protein (DUF1015 family)
MADWMLCAIFAADELHNAPHHRLLTPAIGIEAALEAMGRHRRLRRCSLAEVEQRSPDEIALFADAWYCLTLPRTGHFLDDIDPSRWQHQIVAPLFHLDPEGDDPALGYLAGDRSLDDLAAIAVDHGAIAVVMREVPIEVLLRAADEGLVMPPKSTYFEPKVRSGVFIRRTTE